MDTFFPGELAVIRDGAEECLPRYWGLDVEVVSGPTQMHYWNPGLSILDPPTRTDMAYFVQAGIDTGWVFADNLRKKRPPREPTCTWEDVGVWRPMEVA